MEVWLKVKAFVDAFNADKPRVFDQLLLTLRGMEADADEFEQWATLKVGVRLPVSVSPEDWYGQLSEIAHGAIVEPLGFAVPAWGCEKNTPLVRAFLHGIRAKLGEPRFVYKTGTADLNIVAPAWKCPAVVYGPGDSALDHTPNEHIKFDDYANAAAVVSSALEYLVSRG